MGRSCEALARLTEAIRSPACGSRCRSRAKRIGRIEMINANILSVDISRASAVLLFSTCYPADMQLMLQRKILHELRPGTRVYAPGDKWWNQSLTYSGRRL